jgi:hypothetical protein
LIFSSISRESLSGISDTADHTTFRTVTSDGYSRDISEMPNIVIDT